MVKMKEIQNYNLLNDTKNTTLPDPKQALPMGNYIVERNQLFATVKEEETGKVTKSKVGDLVWIDKINRNLETGVIVLELLFYSRHQYHQVMVTRDIFNEKNVMILTDKGADIRLENYKAVVRFLQQQEREIKKTHYLHTSLGWIQNTDSLIYYHEQSLMKADDPEAVSSTYNGGLAIQPTGSFEDWEKAITEHVLGHPPLEFALVYGFSAAVNALLAKWRPMEVLIVHIYGDSSTGKTTASRVAVSGFGKPSSDGLLKNWNATFNALMKLIASNHGVPMVLDESSSKTGSDFTSIIYQLAEGRDKNRLNSDIELRAQQKWSGAFLSTGEHRLTEKSNNNSGLMVRVPEFGSKPWTKSANHAQAIKNALEKNNGQAGPLFVQHIIDTFEKEEWLNGLDAWRDVVLEAMETKDSFSERLAEKYAVILLTAEVMDQCFNLEIDTDKLLGFIIENDQESMNGRSLESKSIDYIQQKIIEHQSSFNYENDEFNGNQCYGVMKKKGDCLEVTILKNILDDWLEKGKFSSKQVVLKGLKKEGLLDHEQGKNTRERNLPVSEDGMIKKTVYVLKMPLDLLDVVSTKSDLNKLLYPKRKKPSTRGLGMKGSIFDDEENL